MITTDGSAIEMKYGEILALLSAGIEITHYDRTGIKADVTGVAKHAVRRDAE